MSVVSRYEWDVGNLDKCQKHGVTIAEIEFVLDHEPFLYPDYGHSGAEQRTIAVGANRAGRPVFVVFTVRETQAGEVVRPVSARYMHRKEIVKWQVEKSQS
jgi:uncharacterized DUF497 family protein